MAGGGNKLVSIQRKHTDKVELVETHNLALSLRRLSNIPGQYNDEAARRALYHAICMVHCFATNQRAVIRQALELP